MYTLKNQMEKYISLGFAGQNKQNMVTGYTQKLKASQSTSLLEVNFCIRLPDNSA